MEEEISKLKEIMENKEVKQVAGMEFVQGEISKKQVTVVRSGIGKVNAAACTQILVDSPLKLLQQLLLLNLPLLVNVLRKKISA